MRVELQLSVSEARALAVAAQGLAPAAGADAPTPLDVLGRLGALQLDAIQVADKAHRLVCLARNADLSGGAALDAHLWSATSPATVYESPAHAVCLLPMRDWPLWEFARRRTATVDWAPSESACDRLLALVREAGPRTLRQLEAGAPKSSGWDWSETKRAAEYLVWTGRLVCCERRGATRIYDLAERRVPAELLAAVVPEAEARRLLVDRAARACGVATVADLTEYFRMNRPSVIAAVEELGLTPAVVEGWDEPAWVHPDALALSIAPAAPVFLTPFDNLVWDRDRGRRLFGFDYVFEAYKPAAKRRHGYYAMPLLADGNLIGRADMARRDGDLHALTLAFEPGYGGQADRDAAVRAGNRLGRQLGCRQFVIDRVAEPA